jgi:glutamate racemase
MIEKNIDTVVLGCTHYPFVIPLIQQIAGDKVRVIDPAPAVAKQTQRLLEASGLRNNSGAKADLSFYTSGDPEEIKSLLPILLDEAGEVQRVEWINDSRLNSELTTES